MNLKELKEIIDIFASTGSIEELEIEKSGVHLRIRRASTQGTGVAITPSLPAPSLGPAISEPQLPPQAAQDTSEEFHYIKSPIVGTFYKAPSPTTDPFVSVGDFIEKGTVVCIIEAMKLMNEIESEVAGEVVSILVDNGQPVEYGEKLLAIRPR